MASNNIKTVYSFIVSTIMLDSSTPIGDAMLKQIPPFVFQSLRGSDATFSKLFDQVQNENSPHIMGSGMASSRDQYGAAFLAWLKSRGVTITDIAPLVKKQIFLLAGDAMNPETQKSFNWCMFLYFDLDK